MLVLLSCGFMLAFRNSWDPRLDVRTLKPMSPVVSLSVVRICTAENARSVCQWSVGRSCSVQSAVYVFPGLPNYCGAIPIAWSSSSCA
jgi:hypothetical protein